MARQYLRYVGVILLRIERAGWVVPIVGGAVTGCEVQWKKMAAMIL